MISWFMVEVHRVSRKTPCCSLLELCFSSRCRHFPAQTSWHILPVILAAYMRVHLSLRSQVSCNEVYPCHVHETDSALKICLLLYLSIFDEPRTTRWGTEASDKSSATKPQYELSASRVGQLSPLLFMLPSSPLLIRDASQVPSITHKLNNLSLAPHSYL